MNSDQISSLIRSILKIAGSALAAHGLTADAEIVNNESVAGIIIALVGVIMSINWHSSTPPPPIGGKAALLLALALPLFFTGCTTAYKVEKSADITITAAMSAWGDYVAANHPPAAQELTVKKAFENYQRALLLAIDASEALINASPTNTIAQNLAAADSQAVSAALADLVNILRSFGVKI